MADDGADLCFESVRMLDASQAPTVPGRETYDAPRSVTRGAPAPLRVSRRPRCRRRKPAQRCYRSTPPIRPFFMSHQSRQRALTMSPSNFAVKPEPVTSISVMVM